jgi:hypothetical protein
LALPRSLDQIEERSQARDARAILGAAGLAPIDEDAAQSGVDGAALVVNFAVADMKGVFRPKLLALQGGVEDLSVRLGIADSTRNENLIEG